MKIPRAAPQDVTAPCGYQSFEQYEWKDVSCNFTGWGHHIPWNPAIFCLYAAATTAAFQLCLQLIGRTIARFKRRNTLYFWSLISVAIGIMLYASAFVLRIFVTPVGSPSFSVLFTPGQIFILTGFGLVMYSRLHLITNDRRLLRALFIMICVIAVLGHTMTFVQLAVISLKKEKLYRKIYNSIAWLDVIFTLQDLMLSASYIYLFWKRAREAVEFSDDRTKRRDRTTMRLLIGANVIVLVMDIIQNVLLCMRIYLARCMWFPLICAIKLEAEFFVLNRLVKSTEETSHALQAGQLMSSFPMPNEHDIREVEKTSTSCSTEVALSFEGPILQKS